MKGRMCDGCGKPGGTPVQGKWYLHGPCSKPFREGVARGAAVSLAARDALLEACEAALAVLNACEPSDIETADAKDKLRAAIALAKGESMDRHKGK